MIHGKKLKEFPAMDYPDIRRKLKQSPFKPFRLCLTDGAKFDVRHPELLLLAERFCVVGLVDDPKQDVPKQVVEIDLDHIVRTEELEVPIKSSTGSNGPVG